MFVSLPLPPAQIEDLDEFLAPRREASGDLSWTLPEQWHVTLAFMASVPDRSLDRLIEHLSEVADRTDPFTLALGGGGAIPHPDAAKVLHLSPAGEIAALDRLAERVRTSCGRAGVEIDGKAFHPHLTVARCRRPLSATKWLRVLDSYRSTSWTVESFDLVGSHLGEGSGGRVRHEVVERFGVAV